MTMHNVHYMTANIMHCIVLYVCCVDDVDDGLGLPVQLPPTAYERSTLCKCKPRPTPPPRVPKITVSFKEPSYSNIESGGNITFTVQASPASTKPFSVGFCTQDSNPVSAEGKQIIPLTYKVAKHR